MLLPHPPEDERILLDVLHQIVRETLPSRIVERPAFGVPSFYGNRAICLLWPASVKGGGIREGVLLGFWQGPKLEDPTGFLRQGTNKRIFYRLYRSVEEVEEEPLVAMLREALRVDEMLG
jgi:hypothetical protein